MVASAVASARPCARLRVAPGKWRARKGVRRARRRANSPPRGCSRVGLTRRPLALRPKRRRRRRRRTARPRRAAGLPSRRTSNDAHLLPRLIWGSPSREVRRRGSRRFQKHRRRYRLWPPLCRYRPRYLWRIRRTHRRYLLWRQRPRRRPRERRRTPSKICTPRKPWSPPRRSFRIRIPRLQRPPPPLPRRRRSLPLRRRTLPRRRGTRRRRRRCRSLPRRRFRTWPPFSTPTRPC